MKKAYYIVTTVISGLFTAFFLFLVINFIIFFEVDGTLFGTGVFALVGAGFLAVSVFGLIKKTFVLSAVLAKIGVLAIGAGTLVFTLMAYEHDLGPRPVSFAIIAWLIGLAFIGLGIFVSFMRKNKRKSPNIDKLLVSPIYTIIPEELRTYISRAILDYNTLPDDEMMEKYKLNEIWFSIYEYREEKSKGILGFILLNLLVDKGYAIQVDYKENPRDYLSNIREYWDCETKIVEFEADNDQIYLAKVPADSTLENIYEIKIKPYNG